MKIVCDSCSTKYSIADEKVRGKVFKIKCKKCSHVIVVKGTEAGAEGGAAAAPSDNKETSVFEYGKTEMNGAAAGDAVWYLVVDREQVGPLTVAEVEGRYKKGEIDSETYGWREGFSDWLRVAAIPEFGAFAGGGDTGQTPAPSADPSDLFGGGAKPDAGGGGGDLFGGRAATTMPSNDTDVGVFAAAAAAPARRTVPKEDLFGGGGGGGASAGGELAGGGDVKPLTAQRNENSVLFSLKNLTDLASTGPKTAPSGGGGGGGGAAPAKSAFTSGGGEGSSGLIDIRAMAATVGVGGAKPASSSSSDDDLPVFSAASFGAPSAGMLLPTVSTPEKSNKVLFALIGIVGVLAIAAIVMVVVVLKSNKGDGEAGKDKMAAATPGEDDKDKTMPAAGATPPSTPTTPGATPPPTTPTDGMAAVTPPPKDEEKKEPERTSKPKSERTSKPKGESKAAAEREEEAPPPTKPAATKKPACDEVACLVDSSLPCCKSGGSSGGGGGGGGSDLPDQLDRSAIQSGIASVRGRVQSCNDKFKQAGQVNVRFVVSPSGSVESATVSGKFAGSPTGSCVESAIESAKFKKAGSKTVVNNYPFIFK